MSEKQHEAAEAFLLREVWQLPEQAAALLFDLYGSWGRLAQIDRELPKFHLTQGIEKEVLHRASEARAKENALLEP